MVIDEQTQSPFVLFEGLHITPHEKSGQALSIESIFYGFFIEYWFLKSSFVLYFKIEKSYKTLIFNILFFY